MENLFNNIHYKKITYSLNPENSYYQMQPQIVPFDKLPQELKVEDSKKDFLIKQGANEIIRGRIRDGVYTFFTGLIPISQTERIYFGNKSESIRGKKVISLLVFHFSSDSKILTIYYFNHFYIHVRAERIKFIIDFINSIGLK